jgi:hypothetical protein
MEIRYEEVPAQPTQTPKAPVEKKRRFKLIRLEERIAPSGPIGPNSGSRVGCDTSDICGGNGHPKI